jgi:manganese/zinc/iron transport system permease protein
MMDVLADLFSDYTLRTVALGAALLGVTAGTLGGFALLRRQSLLGDAISHAALPGIALAFLITGSKSSLVLVTGAGLVGWLGSILITALTRRTPITYDTALGLLLSVFFGFGLVLLTVIQRMPDANQAGLDSFLFGQAAALVQRDILVIFGIGSAILLITGLLWKEFKLISFDPDVARTLGLPVPALEHLLTALFVAAIVIGLQTVGVVLMSALMIAPAAAARQWTDRLWVMIVLAAFFGAFSGVGGAIASSLAPNLPTGPIIVLIASTVVAVSLLLAPKRGVISQRVRRWRLNRVLTVEGASMHGSSCVSECEGLDNPHPEEGISRSLGRRS